MSKHMASRWLKTLHLGQHAPFVVELDRLVVLGGKTLVALWRAVGVRHTPRGPIMDRNGEEADALMRLRKCAVRCFTTESSDARRQPLVHDALDKPGLGPRSHTIEQRTPGLAANDGFVHTTLVRFCWRGMSAEDVSLQPLHDVARDISIELSGHRFLVDRYVLLETTGSGRRPRFETTRRRERGPSRQGRSTRVLGAGGDSNPCYEPIARHEITTPPRFATSPSACSIGPKELALNRTPLSEAVFAEPPPQHAPEAPPDPPHHRAAATA